MSDQRDQLFQLLGLNPESSREKAFTQGLLSSIFQAAALSGPQPRPVSTAQALGQVGLAGMGAYESSFDKTLKEALTGLQVKDLVSKQAESERMRKAAEEFRKRLAGATRNVPTTGLTEGSQQATMLAEQMGGFAPEDIAGTRQALLSAGATQPVTDQAAADRAVMDYLRVAAPTEYAKLIAKEPKESFRPLSAAEAKKLGLPENTAFQISSTGKISQVGQGPLVTVGPSETALQKGFAEFGVQQNTKIYTAGQNAFNNLPKIEETISLLKSGSAQTGLGAELMKNVSRVQAAFTGSKKSIKEVSDTELLDSLLGSEVFPQIGALGIGARGLDTPAEREFLRQVMTGTISMNKDTLIRMAEIRKKYEDRALKTYNDAVKSGQLDSLFQFSGLPKRTLNPPVRVDY